MMKYDALTERVYVKQNMIACGIFVGEVYQVLFLIQVSADKMLRQIYSIHRDLQFVCNQQVEAGKHYRIAFFCFQQAVKERILRRVIGCNAASAEIMHLK